MHQYPYEFSELKPQDLQEVLRRAQEIDAHRVELSSASGEPEMFLRAAEDAGISREALVQALRERLGSPLEGIKPGDRVFAKSADGAFYAADLLEVSEGSARVRFLNGSDHTLPRTDLRPFAILPGQKLQCKWPMWGWYTSRAESFDPQTGKVRASDGGWNTKSFDLDKVRLRAEKSRSRRSLSGLITGVAVVSALLGGVLGALLMHLFR